MAARTAWASCAANRWWRAFGKPRRGKGDRPGPAVHDDRVNCVFTASASNQLWLTDITEHRTSHMGPKLRLYAKFNVSQHLRSTRRNTRRFTDGRWEASGRRRWLEPRKVITLPGSRVSEPSHYRSGVRAVPLPLRAAFRAVWPVTPEAFHGLVRHGAPARRASRDPRRHQSASRLRRRLRHAGAVLTVG
jgi:hypothetical protein